MHNNPFPNDPINIQSTDIIPPLPDLPPKPVQQAPQPVAENTSYTEKADEGENILLQPELPGTTLAYVFGKVNDFLQWFVIVLEIALFLRFLFKLIGASPENIFASFLYALTTVILLPFSNLVTNPSLHADQAFEWTTLIAMGIYALIFWLIRRLVRISITPPKPEE